MELEESDLVDQYSEPSLSQSPIEEDIENGQRDIQEDFEEIYKERGEDENQKKEGNDLEEIPLI